MVDDLVLNVPLLRRRVPNLTAAAKTAGLRPATVSNLCTGKTPVGRAEVRTLVTLATLAGCSLDDLIIRGSESAMIETGIKVLDVFAPLVRGGISGFKAEHGQGMVVLVAELLQRTKKRGYVTVFWKPLDRVIWSEDLEELSDHSFTTKTEIIHFITNNNEDKDIVLCADKGIVFSGELTELKENAEGLGQRPITYLLIDMSTDQNEPADHAFGPLDTLFQFDLDLANRHFYPALNPLFSTSTISEGAMLEANHQIIQQRARKLLRRFRELRAVVSRNGVHTLKEGDKLTFSRGEKLEAYLTQPFYVAEELTKQKGEWVPLHEALEDIRKIMDGVYDQKVAKEFMFTGSVLHV